MLLWLPIWEKRNIERKNARSSISKNNRRINLNINFRHLEFSDHYKYESKDIKKIIKTYQKSNDLILTTEKDAQKLKEFNELKNLPVYYLKVTIDFLWNKDKFDKKIKDYVGSYSSN